MRFEEILTALEEGLAFCQSVGLGHQARVGRFGHYTRRITRLMEVLPRLRDGSVSSDELQRIEQEGILYRVALTEGLEAGDITAYLRRARPAGFESRLNIVLGGPELPSDEDATSSHARNIQFELLMAHALANAGFQPQLAEPDLRVEVLGRRFHLACKRIFSPSKLRDRLEEARGQLRRSLRDEIATARGIVVISLSRVLNPDARVLAAPGTPQAAQALDQWLTEVSNTVQPEVERLFQANVVLVLFHASSDFNMATGRWERGTYFVGRPDPTPFALHKNALEELVRRLDETKTIDAAAAGDLRGTG